MKILVIEDDNAITSLLQRALKEEGYSVDVSNDALEGEYLALNFEYDLIILDWMMPQKDGIDILKVLRDNNIKTPVIFLTAKDRVNDKVEALNLGADDYLTKPFSLKELYARVNAVYRRVQKSSTNILSYKDIKVDLDAKKVYKGDDEVNLTAKEYEIFLFLLRNRGSYISSSTLYEIIGDGIVSSNSLEVLIYRVRKKLGKDVIRNSRNLGYIID